MPNYATVPATRLHELFTCTPKTGVLVWKIRPRDDFKTQQAYSAWNTKYSGTIAGTKTGKYITVRFDGQTIRAHCIVFAMTYGKWPDDDIDHIDGDCQNNSISNLRCVNRSVNMRNAARKSTNKSGVNGVYWHSTQKKWRAFVRVDYRQIHLGSFERKEDAVLARRLADDRFGFTVRHGQPVDGGMV